jgi:internalin A
LSGLSNLSTLNLYGIQITDEGLKELSGLTSLTTLDLSYSRVTEDGLMQLKKTLPKVKILE